MKDERPVIIIGAGGHARVLASTLKLLGKKVLGFTDSNPEMFGAGFGGIPVLGDDSVVFAHAPDGIRLVNGVGCISVPHKRERIFQQFKSRGYGFQSVIHPGAIVCEDVSLGEGVQVMMGALIQTGCHIEENVIVNTGAIIDHDTLIHPHCHIAPGAVLSGNCLVGRRSLVGVGATVLQSIQLGESSLIAAGAVVIRNTGPNSRIFGVPGREKASSTT